MLLFCGVLLASVECSNVDPTSAPEVAVDQLVYNDPVISFMYHPGMTIEEILKLESSTWHWYPWKHVQFEAVSEGGALVEKECEKENSLDELPEDLFTRKC